MSHICLMARLACFQTLFGSFSSIPLPMYFKRPKDSDATIICSESVFNCVTRTTPAPRQESLIDELMIMVLRLGLQCHLAPPFVLLYTTERRH
jgi:hypothetical protein